jgi:hypothetical protein
MKIVIVHADELKASDLKRGMFVLPVNAEKWSQSGVENNLLLVGAEVENRSDGAYRQMMRVSTGEILWAHYSSPMRVVEVDIHVKV